MTLSELTASVLLSIIFCFFVYIGFVLPTTQAEEVKPIVQEVATQAITHGGYAEESIVQDYVRYAYKISGGDLDFVATLEAENGRRDPTRQSEVVRNGHREESYGFCQMMRKYHKEVDTKRFREDAYYQLDLCYSKYKGGTKFYGYNVRNKVKDRFILGDKVELVSKSEPVYPRARVAQDTADKLWEACILVGECK